MVNVVKDQLFATVVVAIIIRFSVYKLGANVGIRESANHRTIVIGT